MIGLLHIIITNQIYLQLEEGTAHLRTFWAKQLYWLYQTPMPRSSGHFNFKASNAYYGGGIKESPI